MGGIEGAATGTVGELYDLTPWPGSDGQFSPEGIAITTITGVGAGGGFGAGLYRPPVPAALPDPVVPPAIDVPAGPASGRAPTTLTNIDPEVPAGDVLRLYNDGSGFSGAYEPQSNQWVALASGDASLVSGQPAQTVSRFGGHAAAQEALVARTGITDTSGNVGFVLVKQGDNALDIRWNSGQINFANFGQSAAPEHLRPGLRQSVADTTGFEVSG